MSAIGNVLQRLFSQKLIIKKMPGNRLKTIDYDKLQSIGNAVTGKYAGVRSSLSDARGYGYGYGSLNSDTNQIDAARNVMYVEYEAMDSDAILSSALDIYADETTVKNEHGNILTIHCDDAQQKAILYNLFHDILNIEFNLWHWVRSVCKYGDMFLYLPSMPSIGILDAIPIHPSLVKRNDFAGPEQNMTEYIYDGESNSSYASYIQRNQNVFKYHEMAHFRILTDTNYIPYGKSLLEGARKTFKQLTMMEDAMLIHRIMRAPEKRVFKIDVGNLPPESIDAYMEEISNSMKKVPYKDPETGDYNLRFNLMNMLEDFYLPTRGGDSSTEIETLQGLSSDGNLEDIEYLLKKQMAYLKIPRAYLGYDEGVEGKGTLAAEDIKFARFIERIQKIIVSELEKIGHIHLSYQGYRGEKLTNFKLNLTTPSIIYERQKVDLFNEKMNLVSNMIESKLFSRQYIYENLFNMSPEEWQAQQDLIIEDLKRAFREEQITNEGNDPAVTGKSFGTPHDIVSMQMASKTTDSESENLAALYKKDDRHDNPGRPEKHGSFERDKDTVNGRDPSGRKAFASSLNASKSIDIIQKSMQRSATRLTENTKKTDNIKMLSEDSLLNDEE